MYKINDIIELDSTVYILKEHKGNGGSGTVWGVESGNNKFAIKFIISENQSKIKRFQNEISF